MPRIEALPDTQLWGDAKHESTAAEDHEQLNENREPIEGAGCGDAGGLPLFFDLKTTPSNNLNIISSEAKLHVPN